MVRKDKHKHHTDSVKSDEHKDHAVTQSSDYEHKPDTSGKRDFNLWMPLAIIFALLFIGAMGVLLSKPVESDSALDVISEKVIDYVNNNLVEQGTKATVKSVEQMNGIYKIVLTYQAQDIPVYTTTDGQYIFLSQPLNTSTPIDRGQSETQKNFDAPDVEKPNVKLFVMSFCPYGHQAEKGIVPVISFLKNKINPELHYVIYGKEYCNNLVSAGYYSDIETCQAKNCMNGTSYCSMHGISELNEDVRQLCITKIYSSDTLWSYVLQIADRCSSVNVDTCWKPVAESVGIDTDKIEQCFNTEAKMLIESEAKLNEKYVVSGSPTIFINEEPYEGSRSADAFQQAICSGFVTMPEECSQQIQESDPSTAAPSGGCEVQ